MKKKKYILTLIVEQEGRVVVEAKDRKEAQEKGEEIISKSYSDWYETSCEEIDAKPFNKKTHEHEYCWGTDKCFCGKVYKGKG